MRKTVKKRALILVLLGMGTITLSLIAFDQSRFFHAQYFPQEPRFEEKNLTSLMLRAFTGKTYKQTDSCGTTIQIADFTPEKSYYQIQSVILDVYQNIHNGFYMGATVPWYHFKIDEFCNGITHEKKIVTSANICLIGGYTHNYEACEELDFIDFTLETGLILPTGDNHLQARGVLFRGATATGLFDWITTGISADIVGFFDHHNGRLWDITWYLKADHALHGISCLLAYTHSNQHKTPVPWSNACLPFWTMDTLNFELSFDSACFEHPFLPSFYFYYNHVLSGKNVIRTPQTGLGISFDF